MYVCMYVCMYMYMYMYDGYTTSVLPFLLGEQLSVARFEKGGSEKMTFWANVKSFCHAEYLPSCQEKRLSKIKYGFEFSISNFDLGLFYPSNQLMFSFVTFWFC